MSSEMVARMTFPMIHLKVSATPIGRTPGFLFNAISLQAVILCAKASTVHVTSYLRKSDEFRGNPSQFSVKTCAEISGMYSASLRIVCSESADCLHLC